MRFSRILSVNLDSNLTENVVRRCFTRTISKVQIAMYLKMKPLPTIWDWVPMNSKPQNLTSGISVDVEIAK